MDQPPDQDLKCSRCSNRFLHGQFVLRYRDRLIHFWCWRILTSLERLESRVHQERSEAIIAQSAAVIADLTERLGFVARPRANSSAGRCIVCETAIPVEELEMTLDGAIHGRCRSR
jgi:hypothetical protein